MKNQMTRSCALALGLALLLTACGAAEDEGAIGSADTQTEIVVTDDAATGSAEETEESQPVTAEELGLEDGSYTAEVTLTGGTGRASVQSPAALTVQDGAVTATIIWSSSNYDYMLLDDERLEPVSLDPGSTFEIPVSAFDTAIPVTADTTAMSEPHEIDYTLTFDSASIQEAE